MKEIYVRWTPTIHNPCNENLFQVICNVWANPINNTVKVIVSTPNEIPFCNILSECLEDFLQATMEQTTLEISKLISVCFLLRT